LIPYYLLSLNLSRTIFDAGFQIGDIDSILHGQEERDSRRKLFEIPPPGGQKSGIKPKSPRP
jgi:hypothetical protein